MAMASRVEARGREEEREPSGPPAFPLHGDLLVEVLSHLPTVDLVPALHVSAAWRRAARDCLRRAPRSKPWLLLRAQSRRRACAVTAHAYDPHSGVWLDVPSREPPRAPVSAALRSSPGCGAVYEATPSGIAVCGGSLGAPWRDLGPPRAWRTDPVVAPVGGHVLVAGGTCGFLVDDDGDRCTVELHRADGAVVECEPLPSAFGGSASATFLSAACSSGKVYLMEKSTGLLCSFDVEAGKWEDAAALLRPDPSLFSSSIAFSGRRLILAGLGKSSNGLASLGLWAVDSVTFECESIGGMPPEMLRSLAGGEDGSPLCSVDISAAGDFAYIFRASEPTVVYACDFADGKCCWTEVRLPGRATGSLVDRFVFTCADVRTEDLRRVFWPAVGGC